MYTKIKILTIIFATILIGFTSCKKETYSIGDLTPPSDLVVTTKIVGSTKTLTNGDGSGKVIFTFSAKGAISYKIDFGDGSQPVIIPPPSFTKKFSKVGNYTYKVVVTALGKGGSTISTTKELTVYYAYQVDPAIVTMLTGDKATGKQWMVDKDALGNMGLGPIGTYTPDYYQAGPNEKVGDGLYDDVYTFTNTKMFTDSTGGDLFGSKVYFARDFDPALPGSFGGYGNDWILTYPTYSVGFDYDGDAATSTSPARVYINFQLKGHCGYYAGAQKYEILSITDSTMWLRCEQPDPDVNLAYYVKLKAVK